ncbi:MAG: hypothetical protein QOE66_829 [Chloroflexota bacterium]|nr:hypothetical protein [Chloroflexota bacterium]
MTGLAPSPEDVEAFEQDEAPDNPRVGQERDRRGKAASVGLKILFCSV